MNRSALVRREVNFTDLYAQLYPGRQARNITFIVTHDCNLRCSYCYEHNKARRRMDWETAKDCVNMLFREDARGAAYLNEQAAHGVILDFIGGEPLLEIELIDRTVDYFREKAVELGHRWATQYMVSMTTNGLLYFDETVQRFLEKNRGRVSMSVTVDGDRETHDSCRVDCAGCGSYERSSAAAEDARERYGFDGTKFTIAPANVERVFTACKDLIEKSSLRVFHCNCVYEEGWTEELAGVLYRELKQLADWIISTGRYEDMTLSIFDDMIGKPLPGSERQNWCGGTGKMLAFDVDGTVYPCLRYAPLSVGNRPPLRIGDAEHGIGVLPQDRDTVSMLDAITRQSQSGEECLRCPIASGCGWCSAYNYEVTGTPDRRVTFICPTHKARCMAACYYWNRIYRKEGTRERFPMNVPREWAVPIVGEDEYHNLRGLAQPDQGSEGRRD